VRGTPDVASLPAAPAGQQRGQVARKLACTDLAQRHLDPAQVLLHYAEQFGQVRRAVRIGLAHGDDQVVVDARPEHQRDPLDVHLEAAGEPAVFLAGRGGSSGISSNRASTCTRAFATAQRSL
jgi:hypothetical protein